MPFKPQKGKQGTKGQKQIVEENAATLSFYRNMVFIANGIYLTVTCVLSDTFTIPTIPAFHPPIWDFFRVVLLLSFLTLLLVPHRGRNVGYSSFINEDAPFPGRLSYHVHWPPKPMQCTKILFLFAAAAYIASFQFMAYMARPNYAESGQLIDSGVDLNMEGGIAEHVKDLIILTSACQLLSLISNYFWLLWLLAPARGFWLLWVSILSPWFFQQAPPTQEIDEKKQRKLERRMKRQ